MMVPASVRADAERGLDGLIIAVAGSLLFRRVAHRVVLVVTIPTYYPPRTPIVKIKVTKVVRLYSGG